MTAALEIKPADDWTEDGLTTFDLDELPADGRRRELIDGVLHMPPSPSWAHQTLAGLLMARMHAECPAEFAVTQAVEVRVSTLRSFIPDVMVVTADATTTPSRKSASLFRPEAVILVVEIVSPSTVAMDRVMKPALYAEADIPYYWRIETAGGVAVHTHKLDPSARVYRETGAHHTVIETDEPWPIHIPIKEISPR